MSAEHNRGVVFALACYGSWGLFPVFWKLTAEIPPTDVLAYRVVWSLAVVALVLTWSGRWAEVGALLASRRRVAVLAASTLCISVNWLVFIQAVGEGKVLDAGMGYFLNPLVNVALGVLVLKERLRPLQWTAVGLALAGLAELTIAQGSLPLVALTLAATFGVYGLLRKRLPASPLTGLAVETGLMLPFALAYIAWRLAQGEPMMGGTPALAAILAASGPVTALPLLWFAAAATRLRYTTLGFFQYVAPTGHFLLAVLVYGEVPGPHRLFAFACIWAAIALYLYDGMRRNTRRPA